MLVEFKLKKLDQHQQNWFLFKLYLSIAIKLIRMEKAMKLIDKAKLVAIKLQWLKPIAMLLVILSVGMFGYVIFGKSGMAADDQYLLPSVMVLIWAILLCAFLFTFKHVPGPIESEQGFFTRLKIRLQRFYYFVLLLLCLATTLAIVMMSFRALNVWSKNFG